jgi:cation transport ATPase
LTVLASLQPKVALLLPNYSQEGGEGGREDACEMELALIKSGDVLRVLPGSSVPTDGVVVEGRSYVNESMVTGKEGGREGGREGGNT